MSSNTNNTSKQEEERAQHKARIDLEWRRSIESGLDIEKSEVAELFNSDLDSTLEEDCCFEDGTNNEENISLNQMARIHADQKQGKISFDRKKGEGSTGKKIIDVSTSDSDVDLCENRSQKRVLQNKTKFPVTQNRPRSRWISKRKSVPVTVKKEQKRRKRKVKKSLGLDPFQQADFAKHTGKDFYGF